MISGKRRSFVKKLGIFSGLGLTSLQSTATPPAKIPFKHIVFFWLKDNSDEALTDFEMNTKKHMDSVSEVKEYHIGRAAGTPRDVVDNSYSICLVASFKSKEDQDKYQVHQAHLDYIEKQKDKWTRVQVYDSWAG